MAASSGRTYRLIVGILALITLVLLGLVGLALVIARPPSARAIAATLTAMPSPTPTARPTPTAVPTLAGVTPELLVCQRQAALAMNARGMVGAANLADDGQLVLRWVAHDWPVSNLDSALPGVILGFDAALAVWEDGCALYDWVQIEVHDRRAEQQAHQLTVRVQVDDLRKWRDGELDDSSLLDRLEVIHAP